MAISIQQPNTTLPKTKVIQVYTAYLNQSGANNPVATILHNTLGAEIVWTRTGAGVYEGTLASGYKGIPGVFITQPTLNKIMWLSPINETVVKIQQTSSTFTPTDGIAYAIVEIRIYNND